ncbi:MAG: hypothetical protein ACLP9K_00260 [Nitrososphaerales archaeon]
MPSRGGRIVLDLSLAGILLYIGVWVYELANWASLTLLGFRSTLSLSGLLPSGVSAVSTVQGDLVFAKPLQIVMSVGTVLPLLFLLRRYNLPATKFTIIGTASAYCATAFWEALSISWISATPAGQGFFAGLNLATMFLLVFAFQKVAQLGSSSPLQAVRS